MRRKILIIGLLLTAFSVSAVGCGKKGDDDKKDTTEKTTEVTTEKQDTEEPDTEAPDTEDDTTGEDSLNYDEIYGELIEHYHTLICAPNSDFTENAGEIGVCEAVDAMGTTEALNMIGYTIRDISGDGTPELIIGMIDDSGSNYGSQILAVYTCVEGKTVLSFEGRSRSSYFLMDSGDIYYSGSEGAMYSIFGIYNITKNGVSLECRNFFFTMEKDDSFTEIGYYTNTTGEWDKSVSQEISEEEFMDFYNSYDDSFHGIEFTPFATLGVPENTEEQSGPELKVEWSDNVLGQYENYTEFVADNSDYSSKVAFIAGKELKDFKVLSLFLEDITAEGEPVYSITEVYSQDKLKTNCPLVVTMTFVGDIPNYGISYVGSDGLTHKYTVGTSGYDGSLVLMEIK